VSYQEAAGDHEPDSDAYAVIPLDLDDASIRAEQLVRARKLGHYLGVEVAIDTSGWLRHEIEIVVDRRPDLLLWPIKVRVGAKVTDDAVLAHGGIVAACVEYNGVLVRLRQLAEQVAALVREGAVRSGPGSALAYANVNLVKLDQLIAQRQAASMRGDTVLLSRLRREIDFFLRCDAHLTPIVLAAARATSIRPAQEQAVAAMRRPWRWIPWVRNRPARRRS
jgi:hypothetical protein